MTGSVEQRRQDILDAIARVWVADRRMRLGESLGDDVGVQVAVQAILHNLVVISEAVEAIPAEILGQAPQTPWTDIAAMRDVVGGPYQRVDPATLRRAVDDDLGPLELAVRRLRTVP